MKTFRWEAAQCTLRYHDLPGAGRPLLFVHGLGCAASCDYPQVAAQAVLADRRRLLPDLPGSGFSDAPAGLAYRTTDHARALAALVTSLGLEALDVYGHSMGGAVAIELASLLPAQVRHLVLSEPNFDAGGGMFSRAIAEYSEAEYVARGHEVMVRAAATGGAGTWAASLRHSSPLAVHRSACSLVAGVEPSWRTLLLQLPMPRTVIFGELSLPDADLDWLPAHGVASVVLPQAGHSMAWEQPAGLAALIAQSLSR
ncbi:alpha/beta fold hydrolase [Paludibacterium sp. B53371]|uniref:alpha/beta fold hydrolase n=1 Tax=Paludibacterium sp. B53371 TaxID=2806263 RepID=UPI001C054623|nr:alpha/beta hydrolase [Paludibacterium sp. B53371]